MVRLSDTFAAEAQMYLERSKYWPYLEQLNCAGSQLIQSLAKRYYFSDKSDIFGARNFYSRHVTELLDRIQRIVCNNINQSDGEKTYSNFADKQQLSNFCLVDFKVFQLDRLESQSSIELTSRTEKRQSKLEHSLNNKFFIRYTSAYESLEGERDQSKVSENNRAKHLIATKTFTGRTTSTVDNQNRMFSSLSVSLLLSLIALIGSQNALPCHSFLYSERPDDTGVAGYNYPYTPLPTLHVDLNRNYLISTNRPFYHGNGESPLVMPTLASGSSFNSFTQDQNNPLQAPNGQTLDGWASMLTNAFNANHKDTLDAHIRKILVPRVSGTQGNVKVREYIADHLRDLNYHVELDEFTDSTPIGNVRFANIIADSNPNACRQLVLACHYDSKQMDGFLGATDSAVPCAMLLEIAKTFSKSFRPRRTDDSEDAEDTTRQNNNSDLSLRFIFFDGEEAFVEWSDTDSLYGSRHLAAKWDKQAAPLQCKQFKNELSRIEMFVLLDLIGTSDTSFTMYNMNLEHHYKALQKYEKAFLSQNGLSNLQLRRESAFRTRYIPLDFIQDDHVPFKKRGVPILSLLAHPFPKVWHTINDNYQAIDFGRTRRILHVLEQFVANYSKES